MPIRKVPGSVETILRRFHPQVPTVPTVPYGIFTMKVEPIFEGSTLFQRVCVFLKDIFDHHPSIASNPTHGIVGFIFAEFPLLRTIAFLGNPVAVIQARNIVLPRLEEEYGPLVLPEETNTWQIPSDDVLFLQGIPYPDGLQDYLVKPYFLNFNGLFTNAI